jgi:hypothetical protein
VNRDIAMAARDLLRVVTVLMTILLGVTLSGAASLPALSAFAVLGVAAYWLVVSKVVALT